jgi:hypothetical protein
MTVEEMGNTLRKTGESIVESAWNGHKYRHNKRYRLG